MIGTSLNARIRPDHLGAVHVGEAEVEQDQVGRHLRRAEHAFLAGADRRDLVAVRLEARAERATDLRLVVDHEHLHADSHLHRELEHDDGPAAGGALDPDATAVRHDDRLRDREPEAAPGSLRRRVAAIERLEHALALGLRDAGALVRDPHLDRVAVRGRGHLHLAARAASARPRSPGGW